MSRTTYNMSNAQMKRITKVILASSDKDRAVGIRLLAVENAMRDEDVSMTFKATQIRDLVRYWTKEEPNPWLVAAVAEEALREYYHLRGHVNDFHGALRGMEIVPYLEDDE